MAERIGAKKRSAKKKAAKARKVPAADRKVTRSDNRPGVDMDEVYDRHLKIIERTQNVLLKAQAANRAAFSQAKADGCDVDAIKRARKMHEEDHGAVLISYSETARCLRLLKSPLYEQLDMFAALEGAGAKINAASDGLMAGRNGKNRTDNPFTPGSDEFAQWDSNWLDGQKEIAAGMAKEPASPAVN